MMASNRKSLLLSRFKKSKAGLIQLAILIEQAEPRKRAWILEQAGERDPETLYHALKKVVYFDELVFVDESIVAEILSKTSHTVLAYALHGMPDAFRNKMLAHLTFREKRLFQDEEEKIGNSHSYSLAAGARRKILKLARTLEAKNAFVFELGACPRLAGMRPPRINSESKE